MQMKVLDDGQLQQSEDLIVNIKKCEITGMDRWRFYSSYKIGSVKSWRWN